MYVRQGIRYALGDTIASVQAAETAIQSSLDSEVTRAQGAEATIQSALTCETQSREAKVVAINAQTSYLEDRVNTLSDQHGFTNGRIDTEIGRATGVELSLQTQISALLSNTDSVALNSLSELVTDYRENGMGVATSLADYETSNDAALAAALARISLLETFIVSLQDTTSGGGD